MAQIRWEIVILTKIIIVCLAILISFSFVYYAPTIPSILKPLFPSSVRWTEAEIVDQMKTKKYDRDFLVFFYRDPERSMPDEKNIIVAPADGTVKVIKNLNGRSKIVIYLSWWDVHVQRVPLAGTINGVVDSVHEDQEDFKCSNCYQKVTTIETEVGTITVKQVTSFYANRIKLFVKEGEKVKIGDRLGSILLGSHVVIEFPDNVRITIQKGDQVYGGETIIARY